MRRTITLLVVAMVFAVLAGCGGGGGSSAQTQQPPVVEPPPVCTENVWTPDPATKFEDETLLQTSNCGTTRIVNGTKKRWNDREGISQATLFKNYSGSLWKLTAVSDTVGGSVIFGCDSNAKNNKGVLVRNDSTGNESWRVEIGTPLGNTLIPQKVVSDGSRIIPLYERLPLQEFIRQGYDMNGAPIFGENNIGYGLQSVSMVLDGTKLLTSRIAPATPLPAPFPFSATELMYQDMTTSGQDLFVQPLLDPEFVTVDSTGFNIVGRGSFMKYSKDFAVVLIPQTLWSNDSSAVIHDVKTVGDKTYIAGAVNGIVTLTEVGNPAFRNTMGIPIGADRIQLLSDASGNLLIIIGNRVGKIDIATGEISTVRPPAVPANVPAFISGASIYFVVNGNAIHTLPLSQIP